MIQPGFLRTAILFGLVASWAGEGQSSIAGQVPSVETTTPELAELLAKARETGRRKDWAGANRLYAEAVALAPEHKTARFGLGASFILQGQIGPGMEEIQRVLGDNPEAESLASVAGILSDAPPGSPKAGSLTVEYRNRAFEKAEKDHYAESPDGQRVALLAGLALDLDRLEPFRRATANLVKNHPEMMEAQYFHAIRSAMDGEWIASEAAILRAGQLGLDQSTVDRVLAAGVHTKAQTRRYLYYTIAAIVGWAVGLAALLLIGRLLSALTMRSLRVDDPNAAITSGQRLIRRAYRVVIDLAGFYYYISLPMVALLSIVVAVALGYLVLLLPRIPVKLLVIVAGFGLAMLAMIFSIIRSCFIRIKEPEPDRMLSLEEAPALWELTREVAEQVGTRPIDEIWLASGTEMAVFERGKRREKARNRSRRVLILGLEVIEGFRLDAFRAVLAHEYGHFLHRDTAGGDVAMRVQSSMAKFAEAMAQQGTIAWWNLGWQFLRLYHFLFRRIAHGASRLQEIHADRIASLAYGKQAFAEGLRHVVRRSIEVNHGRAVAFDQAARSLAAGPYRNGPDHARDASIRRQVEAEFVERWKSNTSQDDTHPSPVERVRLLERLDAEPGEAPDGWVVDLLADPDELFSEHRGKVAAEIKEYVAAFTDYHANLLTQLDAYILANPEIASAYVDRGNILFQRGEFDRAIRNYDEALSRDAPNLAICYNNRGVARGRIGDSEGAEADLREGLKRDPELARDAWAEIGDIQAIAGQFERAIEAFGMGLAIVPDDPDLLLKRAAAYLERAEFAEAELDYDRVHALDPSCVEARVGKARAALGRNDADRARNELEAALQIDPYHQEARLEWAALTEKP